MRIALISPDAGPLGPDAGPLGPDADVPSDGSNLTGDQGARVASLARALARQGHRVTVYARQDSPARNGSSIVAPRVTVEHIPAGPAAPLPAEKLAPHLREFGCQLAQRWRRNPPDVVHAHFWTSGLAALAATRDLDVPVLQAFESLAAAEQRLRLPESGPAARVRLETAVARSVGTVLARSAQEMSDLARLGVPRTSIKVVPCGVDTALFSPDGPAARRTGRPRLLAVTTLAWPHGLDTVMRALPGIPGAELVIADARPGGRPRADKARRELGKLARQAGVRDRVTLGDGVSPRALPCLLRSADVLVNPAWYEPIGMTVIQAMACGVPVVASDVGSNRDAVVDGTTGALVPPGRPDVLARRLRELLALPVRLEALGVAAADRARARYSWDRIGRETLTAYEHCLRASARTAASQVDAAARQADTAAAQVRAWA
jgi:glycosyltransferase involved in cell wall biosynthesis